jgi:parallel beta-helix repeat protein
MSTDYPAGLDSLRNIFTDDTPQSGVHATAHENLADAVMAMQLEFGINPKGSAADVAARIAAIEAAASGGVAGSTSVKDPVRAATTANILLSGNQTIDGVALNVGDRVLVKNQTSGSENGIWQVAVGAWSRTSDANTAGKLSTGITVAVDGGTTNQSTLWMLTTVGPVTVDTTPLTFDLMTLRRLDQLAAPTADVAMGGHKLTGLADPTNPQDAATQAWTLARSLDDFAAPTATVSMGGHLLSDLADPVSAQDAVTKSWALANLGGGGGSTNALKDAVRVATVANITLSGAQTIDGVSVIAGDRVLVKDQTTASQNGLYVCAAGAWSRATDADTGGELPPSMLVAVQEGSTNGMTVWLMTTTGSISLGTTSLGFSRAAAGRAATVVVAASDSLDKRNADFVCTGTGDEVTLQAAHDKAAAAPAGAGSVVLLDGTYNLKSWVDMNVSAVSFWFAGGAVLKASSYSTAQAKLPLLWAQQDSIDLFNPRVQGSGINGNGVCLLMVKKVTSTATSTSLANGGSFTVADASAFPTSGTFYVKDNTTGKMVAVPYTGKSGNQLTGCSLTASITVTSGATVSGQGGGVHSVNVESPQLSACDTHVEIGRGTGNTGDCTFKNVRFTNGKIGVNNLGFTSRIFGGYIAAQTGIRLGNAAGDCKIETYGLSLVDCDTKPIEALRGAGAVFNDTWIENSGTAPQHVVTLGDDGNSTRAVESIIFAGQTHMHLPASTTTLGTCTITIASPGVVTLTGHGLIVNDVVYFTTTGALPTGLAANTPYYVKTVVDANTFQVSATKGGAAINTSGTQSGTHTLVKPFLSAFHLVNSRDLTVENLFLSSAGGVPNYASGSVKAALIVADSTHVGENNRWEKIAWGQGSNDLVPAAWDHSLLVNNAGTGDVICEVVPDVAGSPGGSTVGGTILASGATFTIGQAKSLTYFAKQRNGHVAMIGRDTNPQTKNFPTGWFRVWTDPGTSHVSGLKTVMDFALAAGRHVHLTAGTFDYGWNRNSHPLGLGQGNPLVGLKYTGSGRRATYVQNYTTGQADVEPISFGFVQQLELRDMTICGGGDTASVASGTQGSGSTCDAIDLDQGTRSTIEGIEVICARDRAYVQDGKDSGSDVTEQLAYSSTLGSWSVENVIRNNIFDGSSITRPTAQLAGWVLPSKGSVTVTIASPAVFTKTAHGLNAGDEVMFETTGALPTGLTADTSYYVIATGLTANQFQVSTTPGGAAVNTSGSQSGSHTLFGPRTFTASAGGTGGTLAAGSRGYKLTRLNAHYEESPAVALTANVTNTLGQKNTINVPTPVAGDFAYKLYRTKDAGSTYYLVASYFNLVAGVNPGAFVDDGAVPDTAVATTLAADYTVGSTTMSLVSAAGMYAGGGVVEVGTGSTALHIAYTSISGTTLQGCTTVAGSGTKTSGTAVVQGGLDTLTSNASGNATVPCMTQVPNFAIGGDGVQLLGARRTTIEGNVIRACDGAGIQILGQNGVHAGWARISDNDVRYCNVSGIILKGARHCTVTGNNVANNGQVTSPAAGIRVAGLASFNTDEHLIEGNTCYDDQSVKTQDYGVWVDDNGSGTANIQIQGNKLRGNQTKSIFVEIAAGACFISGNDVDTTSGDAIDLSGTIGTCTISIATPCVITKTAHGLVAGDAVYFETTGALPTGLSPDTVYYVIAAGLAANSFEVSTTPGGSAVNTSGTQSGTHTLYKIVTTHTVKNNRGHATEQMGWGASVAAGSSSVTVTHGLAVRPNAVILSPTSDTQGRKWWVSAKTRTSFTITLDSAAVTNPITFDWAAQV